LIFARVRNWPRATGDEKDHAGRLAKGTAPGDVFDVPRVLHLAGFGKRQEVSARTDELEGLRWIE
jgi:hypothetical protein